MPLKRGVGELLVVDLIDGAVDEHGRCHQRRRREGLPLSEDPRAITCMTLDGVASDERRRASVP